MDAITKDEYGNCPKCGAKLTDDNYGWSGGSTEAGTGFWNVEVDCPDCGWTLEHGGWCGFDGSENLPEVKEMIDDMKG